jgi:hypothetical protein
MIAAYTLSVILGIIFSGTNYHFRIVFDIIINGVLTASIGVAWLLFEKPIGRIFVSDKVEDTVPFTHPVVIHFIQLTSRVMLCAFFLSFMLSIAAKVYYDHGEKETSSASSSFGLFLFDGMILFNWCYGFYFKTNIAKIAAKYEKEISKQMDSKYHPNNNHNEKSTTKLEMQAIIIHDTNTV